MSADILKVKYGALHEGWLWLLTKEMADGKTEGVSLDLQL